MKRRRARFADSRPPLTQVLRRAVERRGLGPLPVASGLAQVHGDVLELPSGGMVVVIAVVVEWGRAVVDVVVVLHRCERRGFVLVHHRLSFRLRLARGSLSGGVAAVVGSRGAASTRGALGGGGTGPPAGVRALVESHSMVDSMFFFFVFLFRTEL